MAATLPAKLKAAAPDVGRFATRAAQLEKFRPVVSYWCEYYILQQVLNRQLHTTDEECTTYALGLMDKLEAFKSENASNDTVVDDVAAKAYIENFALETFNRGDEAQRNNKVTKQTADTFQASATFMDLMTIWGPLEPELAAKSKFAKFHALRIARAFKAGEDPNASNPVVEQPPAPEELGMNDGVEAELKNMENDAGVYQQPTVESVPESAQPSRPQSTMQNDSIAAPPLPSRSINEPGNLQTNEPDVSPIEPAENANSRAGSVGGGYFPSVPDATSNVNAVAPIDQPPSSTSTFATSDPADFYNAPTPQPPSAPSAHELGITRSARPEAPTPHQMAQPPVVPAVQSPQPPVAPTRQVQNFPPQSAPVATGPPPGGYRDDDESILAAQKHAKWAISALNFEDVPTAVKELRIALQNLGAS